VRTAFILGAGRENKNGRRGPSTPGTEEKKLPEKFLHYLRQFRNRGKKLGGGGERTLKKGFLTH